MQWYNKTPPMHPHRGLASEDFDNMEDMYHMQFKYDLISQDWLELYVIELLDTRYQQTNVKDVLADINNLTTNKMAIV